MQKTITVNGKRFTGNQIARLLDENNKNSWGDYIVYLNGVKYFVNFRNVKPGEYFAPVCSKENANVVSVSPENEDDYARAWLLLL